MIDDQINIILKELEKDVHNALEKASKDVMKEGLQQVKTKSPKRTGKYARGWKQRKNGDAIVLHEAAKPGLTHILEHGYTAKNGRRVGARPHIQKVQDFVDEEVVRRIKKILE